MAPPVQDLVAQGIALVVLELGDPLEARRVLGHEGAPLEELDVGAEVGVAREFAHVVEERFARDAGEGILDPGGGRERMDELVCVLVVCGVGGTYRAVMFLFRLTDC